MIVKLNNNGIVQWQKQYGGNSFDAFTSIDTAGDGAYIAGGYSFSPNGVRTTHHQAWILKIDTFGNLLWQKGPSGGVISEVGGIYRTADGNYIVAGFNSTAHANHDYWVFKLDATGNIIWQKSLGGSNNDYGYGIIQASDLGYVVFGDSGSLDGDITGHHGQSASADIWVVKLAPDNVLPVTLTSFTAQKQHNDILLNWQTATEVNSKQFNIQRSNDGSNFTTIGTTLAAGNSSTPKSYSYTDAGAGLLTGILYYRLEQVDKDGSKYYSKVAVIKNLPADVFMVMPNPVKSTIRVQSKINVAKALVQLNDMNGKIIYTSNKSITAGYFEVGAANLAAGTYNLTIQANGEKYVLRVVKE